MLGDLSWILTASANGEMIIWNNKKLQMNDVLQLDDKLNKFKKLITILTTKSYILCSKKDNFTIFMMY
jgi:hypothetical protein